MWKVTDVTAIVTCFESSISLQRALDSIRDQGPVHIILVDDGSRDCACDRIAPKYQNLTHVKRVNGGHAAALNTGLSRVNTPLATFLDDDDEWLPDKTLRQIELLNSSKCDVVTGGVRNVWLQNGVAVAQAASSPARILGASTFVTGALKAVGPFNEERPLHCVIDWWSRAEFFGILRCEDKEVALLRRIHGGNSGIRNREAGRQDLLQHLRTHLARRSS